MDKDARDAYVAGLKMLARRERSESQVRQRLTRREHHDDAIDAAIAQLKSERAIDDERVAGAMARNEITTRRHGRLRAQRQLESAGIAAATARRAIDEVFAQTDHGALIAAALGRRLRGGRAIADEAEFRRLYRFLITQGFEPDRVMATLRARRGPLN